MIFSTNRYILRILTEKKCTHGTERDVNYDTVQAYDLRIIPGGANATVGSLLTQGNTFLSTSNDKVVIINDDTVGTSDVLSIGLQVMLSSLFFYRQ
mgnify:CR=1 FL=1